MFCICACGGGAPNGHTDAGDGGGDDGGYLPDGGDGQTEEEPPIPGPVIEFESARESTQAAYHAFGTVTPGPDGSPVVSSTFSFNDSDPAPLTLDQDAFGVDVELLPGKNVVAVEAEDQAGNVRREAIMVFFRTGLPSSLDLIDAAEAAGTITAEEALGYRVLAAFKDSRLPAEYRGDDSQGNFDYVVDRLIAAVPTLSEGAKDTLGPFLAPLIYQDPATFPTKGKTPAPKAQPCNPIT